MNWLTRQFGAAVARKLGFAVGAGIVVGVLAWVRALWDVMFP